jgi:hypothetical protein
MATVKIEDYVDGLDAATEIADDDHLMLFKAAGTVEKAPGTVVYRAATTSTKGVIKTAGNTVALAGTGTDSVITPDDLKYVLDNRIGVNTIGDPGYMGYGVGVCDQDSLPSGMVGLPGYSMKGHDNWGNYQYTEGSVFAYVPWFVYRMGHASNPTYTDYGVNSVDTKDIRTYPWKETFVSAITAADPAVVTTEAPHLRTAGDYIWLSHISTDANWKDYSGKLYKVGTVVDSTHFNLKDTVGTDIDASGVADAFSNASDDTGARVIYTGAEAAGYATPRLFIDGGQLMQGAFKFKYRGSKVANGTGWTIGSVKNGLPLSSAAAHNPFVGLTGGANYYYSAVDLAHRIDGVDGAVNASSNFFCSSIFWHGALLILSQAHGQAAKTLGTGTTYCAWYHATYNYPKGLNKNTAPVNGLIDPADCDDAVLTYDSDGYANCGKTGSGDPFAKTTHNGQNCGIADVNGLMWEIAIGMTCIASTVAIEALSREATCKFTVTGHGLATGDVVMIRTAITQADWTGLNSKVWPVTYVDANNFTVAFNSSAFGTAYDAGADPGTVTMGIFYVAKPSTAMKTFTQGNSGATDHWGATGVAALMERFVPPFRDGDVFSQRMGSGTNQVLSSDLSGAGWLLAGAGFPKDEDGIDATGSNLFGKDYYYSYVKNELCLIVSGHGGGGPPAGVGAVSWNNYRDYSSNSLSASSACYPVRPTR